MNEKVLKRRTLISFIISITVFVVIFALALMLGRYKIGIGDFFKAVFTGDSSLDTQRSIIVNLRFSRTIMAVFVGIGLSLSGLLYQETFRNKLVSPDLLGVSTGASVGAALGMGGVFCGVTNCPITSIVLCIEIFGVKGLPMVLLVAAVSYRLSGYYGIYSGQKIIYSKSSEERNIFKYYVSITIKLYCLTFSIFIIVNKKVFICICFTNIIRTLFEFTWFNP